MVISRKKQQDFEDCVWICQSREKLKTKNGKKINKVKIKALFCFSFWKGIIKNNLIKVLCEVRGREHD